MKLGTRIAVVLLVGWLATAGLPARAGGPGGHGGSGGHGFGGHSGHGFFSGRSSAHSSGRAAGRAIGHSFGRFFGHHGRASVSAGDATPLAGAAMMHGKVVELPGPKPLPRPERGRFHHNRVHDFPFGDRFFLFPPLRDFGFGGCEAVGFPRHRFFFFDNGFDCFDGGFFFDPFFLSGFPGFVIGGVEFEEQGLNSSAEDSTGNIQAQQQWNGTGPSESESSSTDTAANKATPEDKQNGSQVVTLLQLRDGSMYGLTEYWVDGNQLHYLTTYGGQNSVALDRIDFERTVQLNVGRGVEFRLRPKTDPQ